MKRSWPWAVLALAPFAILILIADDHGIQDLLAPYTVASPLARFVVAWWWLILYLAIGAHAVCYSVAALCNRAIPAGRRILWSVGMLFGIPFVVPVYWWFHSASYSTRDA
jgi:hypothetical protein